MFGLLRSLPGYWSTQQSSGGADSERAPRMILVLGIGFFCLVVGLMLAWGMGR